jgi:hypothetical protein
LEINKSNFDVNSFLIQELGKSKCLFEQVEYEYILWYDKRKREGFGFGYEYYRENKPYFSQKLTNRILKIIPKFLDEYQQFYILKNLIVEFLISSAKSYLKNVNNVQLRELFLLLKNNIENFSIANISWFINNNIINENDVDEYLKICKFVMFSLLKNSYENVISDIGLIVKKLKVNSFKFKKVIYKVELLDIEFNLKKLKNNNLFRDGAFENYSDILPNTDTFIDRQLLMDEIIKINISSNKSSMNSLSISKDLDYIFDRLNELTRNKTTVRLTLSGGGGVLEILWCNNFWNTILYHFKV